ncbi:hypothetical protein [Cellulomonas sp. Leaf334]|uniref:hypothetical protein n=1 Tax=Cellulomonas sp. Leaf334 TaxID=1736339 RepID=UPI0006FE9182|nr:hypothetical protein [Cellulomonas sp. Leaf334]KQR12228.1 hypothetical protein ASF78_13860 [Cellulomonas sp. Leaf334]
MSSAAPREPEGRATPRAPTEPVDHATTPPTDEVVGSAPPPRPPVPGLAPPPRPEVGGVGFVATSAPPAMPGAVSTGISLWVGSLAAGLLAAGSIVRSQPALRDRFAAEVLERDPTTTLGTAQDAASVLVWVLVGGLVLVWLVHLVLVIRTAGGHGGARWALVLLGLLGAATVLLVQDVLADPDVSLVHDLNRVALLAQAVLALLGSVVLAAPPAGRWFTELRRRR